MRRWHPTGTSVSPALAVGAGAAVWLALWMQAGDGSGLLAWLAAALLAVVTVTIPLLQVGGRTDRDPILHSAVAPSLALMLLASAFAGTQTFEGHRSATWFGWALALYVARDVLVYALVRHLAPGERYAGVLWMVWMLIVWAVVGPGLDRLGVPPPWAGIVVVSPEAVSWMVEEGRRDGRLAGDGARCRLARGDHGVLREALPAAVGLLVRKSIAGGPAQASCPDARLGSVASRGMAGPFHAVRG